MMSMHISMVTMFFDTLLFISTLHHIFTLSGKIMINYLQLFESAMSRNYISGLHSVSGVSSDGMSQAQPPSFTCLKHDAILTTDGIYGIVNIQFEYQSTNTQISQRSQTSNHSCAPCVRAVTPRANCHLIREIDNSNILIN